MTALKRLFSQTAIIGAICLCVVPFPAVAMEADDEPTEQRPDPGAASPMSIKIGDLDLRPGGFIDAVGVIRSTAVGSGLGTAFGAIPLSDSAMGNLRETRFTSQSSRANLLATVNVDGVSVRGFLEVDFLGLQPTNAMVTTNANGLRVRHSFVQLTKGRMEFMGGQGWSVMTPNKVGVSPAPADVFFSQTIDPNSHVGNTWARVAQFRFTIHPTSYLTTAVSLENPQQFVGAAVVLPAGFPGNEVDNNSNVSAPNPYPDVVAKIAYDPHTGTTRQHIEAAFLASGFSTYDPTGAKKYSKTGAGVAVNVNLEPIRNIHIVGTSFLSSGGGRYAIGLAPDFIVNADGSMTLAGMHSYLGGVEATIRKALVFGYYGAVHVDRTVSVEGNGRIIGYGVPGSTAANRRVQESTAGVNYTIWREPRAGMLQLIAQYSYLSRTPWSIPAASGNDAHLNMLFGAVRYTLP